MHVCLEEACTDISVTECADVRRRRKVEKWLAEKETQDNERGAVSREKEREGIMIQKMP